MGRNVTIRDGTGEQYWYLLAGYLAIAILIAGANVFAVIQTGSAAAAGGGVAIFLFVLSAGGLLTYPAIFKDAAYLRGTNQWPVKWWYYILFGLGVPAVLYGVLLAANVDLAGLVGIGSHGVTAGAGSAHYLYQRHKIVGVP